MFIVSAGVARFNHPFGLDLLHETMIQLDTTEWSTDALLEAVEKKMKKNRDLKWQKVVGTIRMSKETYDWLTTPSEEDDDVGYQHVEP